MKPYFFTCLLLLSSTTLVFEAQGARLLPEESTPPAGYEKEQVTLNRRISSNYYHHDLNSKDIISSSGSKVETRVIPGRKEKFSVKSMPEQYPDVLDIAGMDYTSARRKTPIHN